MNFNQIPINLMTPGSYIEFDNSMANQGLPTRVHKIVVIGQRFAAGSVAAGDPVMVTDPAQGAVFFGAGSQLDQMIQALKAANRSTECWAIAVDENDAGAAAKRTVTFGGTGLKAGTLCFYIGGRRYTAGVLDDATPANVATAVAAAVTADAKAMVTATAAEAVVTLTAKWKGETGNDIDFRVNFYTGELLPPGLTVDVGTMTGGSGNPDYAGAIAAMADDQYDTVILGVTDGANLTLLEAELAKRWGPMVQKEGHAFAGLTGTHAEAVTFGNGRNCPHLTVMATGKSPSPPWCVAASVGGVDAFEPDPARPRQTLPLPDVMPPAPADRFDREERDILLHRGISTSTTDAGGRTLIERLVTTYTTNASGLPDPSYQDVCILRTLAYLRFSVRARIAQKYPRYKLASNGTKIAPGQAIVTPRDLEIELYTLALDWEEAGLVENVAQFKEDLIVQRDGSDANRVNAIIPPDLINQFRVFAAAIQYRV